MITYKLAQKLKDAGFPQKDIGTFLFSKGISLADSQKKWNENNAYAPTLPELIEACGDDFILISRTPPYVENARPDSERWHCPTKKGINQLEYSKEEHLYGYSPEEAVANLWLKLNEK